MLNRLKELLNNSYVPLSNFRVSAIVLDKENKSYEGVNIENPSFRSGLCAEQVAIANAVSAGVKKSDLVELHLYSDSNEAATPCFLCREIIYELFASDAQIFLYNKNDEKIKKYRIDELCPHPFEENNER